MTDSQGKIAAFVSSKRDNLAHFAQLIGVSASDLAWILEKGGEMHEKRQKMLEAARQRARRGAEARKATNAVIRGMEGQSFTRQIIPASPQRAAQETIHRKMPHYRLRDAEGRYLRLDCQGITGDKHAAWIGTEVQLRNVVKRFPVARGMQVAKVPAAQAPIPVMA